jgi:alpha/beta hydrolase fold
MRYGPPFRYASRPGGGRVAYQVIGDGDLDLVFLFGWPTHLGLMWENPSLAAFLGCHIGGRLALLLAATYPDEVSAVVTFGSHPATLGDDDYPWGSTAEDHEELLAELGTTSATPERAVQLLEWVAPGEATDPELRHWWRMFSLSAASSAETDEAVRSIGPVDIRGVLGSVRAPVLVLHRSGDRAADVRASRYMAERIPGARFGELPGDDHLPFFGDQDSVAALTQEFLTGATPVVEPDRVLATVLFTDIVDSTRLAAELGDRRRHRLLVGHQEVVRRPLTRFRGREIVCSRTVKELVAGSGFVFDDRGAHRLKGLPDSWQLYAVELAGG